MCNVTTAIQKYINDELRLSQTDISSTLKSREWFLKRIQNVIANRSHEPVLYATTNFIFFGSYFKGTKVKAVDEYDVLVVIDSNNGKYSSGDTKIGDGQGTASPNHKYDKKYYKLDDSGVSPAKMLNWLRGVVTEVTDSFGGEAPIRNGQAVTATIHSSNLKIDLVPAGIFKRISDGSTFYNIPKGDAGNSWIVTSPRADIDLLNTVAKNKNDFRNIIRIAKRIKDTYKFQISSFAIETAIVYHGYYNKWYDNLYSDVTTSLAVLANLFRQGTIQDPYDSENNLIKNVSNLKWYADRIDTIVDRLDKCLQMKSCQQLNFV